MILSLCLIDANGLSLTEMFDAFRHKHMQYTIYTPATIEAETGRCIEIGVREVTDTQLSMKSHTHTYTHAHGETVEKGFMCFHIFI